MCVRIWPRHVAREVVMALIRLAWGWDTHTWSKSLLNERKCLCSRLFFRLNMGRAPRPAQSFVSRHLHFFSSWRDTNPLVNVSSSDRNHQKHMWHTTPWFSPSMMQWNIFRMYIRLKLQEQVREQVNVRVSKSSNLACKTKFVGPQMKQEAFPYHNFNSKF